MNQTQERLNDYIYAYILKNGMDYVVDHYIILREEYYVMKSST